MPATKNASQTVDKGSPGNPSPTKEDERNFGTGKKNTGDDGKRSADGHRAGEVPKDPGSVAHKPGEADAPKIPEKAKPNFK